MRLKHLKLAGFKSFVDPTKIEFTDSLSAVVGPNGCGKSNIIDAVRWVLGESSAKNLRGEGMTDVIFNGSNSRKPVSVASVELLFDNSDGKASGPWASYSEIAIKRQVNRDAQSDYFVNGQKCRRRDISDLLSGTGLGPRSYSIIEQGTISRLVESKPHELRVFIEEAAGITKYKERKRDTENRIKHSRENLSRLADLRHELQGQIDSLETQAKLAQDYTELKQTERELNSNIIVSRWQSFVEELANVEQHLAQCENQMRQLSSQLEQLQAQQVSRDEELISQRRTLDEINAQCGEEETNLARLQLSIEHLSQNAQQALNKQSELKLKLDGYLSQRETQANALQQAQGLVDESTEQLPALNALFGQAREQLSQHEVAFEQNDQAYSQLLHDKQRINAELIVAKQGVEQVAQDQIKLTNQLDMFKQKRRELLESQQQLNPKALEQQVQHQQQQLMQAQLQADNGAQQIDNISASLRSGHQQANDTQRQLDDLINQKTTFDLMLQQQSGDDPSLAQHYADSSQLWQAIEVQSKWQQAVQKVLAPFLTSYITAKWPAQIPAGEHGIIVDDKVALWPATADGNVGQLVPLNHVISCDNANIATIVNNLCHGMLCVESIEQAQKLVDQLSPQQSLVTPCGCWFGAGFALLGQGDNAAEDGLLALEQRRKALEPQIDSLTSTHQEVIAQNESLQASLDELKQQHVVHQQALGQQKEIAIEGKQRWLLEQQQWQHIAQGLSDIDAQTQHANQLFEIDSDQKKNYKLQVKSLSRNLADTEEQLKLTSGSRQIAKQQVKVHQGNEQQAQQAVHQQELQIQKHQLKFSALEAQLEQINSVSNELAQELDVATKHHLAREPELAAQQQQLKTSQRTVFELKERQQQQTQLVQSVSEQGSAQGAKRQSMTSEKDKLSAQISKLSVKSETLKVKISAQEQALELGSREMSQLALALGDVSASKQWQTRLGEVQGKLAQMGAINLTAIEQYNEQKERLDYLTEQSDDLEQGLKTLETAIRKIDRQSRDKFKTTFDNVNRDFKTLFPKVFGGGSAQLTLTDSDLLTAGVSIMAQPPGKKNSTIALLSGGEKALTALSLVFAIFGLNPAPFCMLDEVDAPLDDANVDRYCNLVKEMSQTVQFIYITHNKVSMEMATQLTGVTMQEAGVSRVVTVDVDMAVSLVQE